MIPSDAFTQIINREDAEHGERDDFLNDLQLHGGIDRVAPAIGRDHQHVFKKRDAPAHEDDDPERHVLVFQMAVPRERHENIRAGQKHDRQPAGFSKIHAAKMNSPA